VSKSLPVAVAVSVGLCAIGAATTRAPATAPAEAAERARLMGLQRDALGLLKQVARAGEPVDDIRRALRAAGERLAALDVEAVGPELRVELRRAASELAEAARRPEGRFDAAPALGLLERVRVKLEGEMARASATCRRARVEGCRSRR
jgi:hypothetical protein